MNSILVATEKLTQDEQKYFKIAQNIVQKNNTKEQKSHKKGIIISIIIILILIALFCTIFALINIKNDKILKNVSVLGLDVSNLSREDAINKLNSAIDDRTNTDLVLKHNEQTYILLPTSIEVSYNAENAVNEAYLVGREGNLIQNNFKILSQFFNKKDVTMQVSLNENLLNETEAQINDNLEDGEEEPSYEVDEDSLKLIVYKGKNGYKVDMKELKKLIVERMLESFSNNEESKEEAITIPVVYSECSKIDIDKIHEEIYKEAKDASYTTNPFSISPSSNGLDFTISTDEAKKMIESADKDSYEIKLKVLYPKVPTSSIGDEAFPNLLASYSTSYSTSNANRSNNIALATKKLNGVVLMPGETFSYNSTIGQRTISAGFKEAGAYSNGQVVSAVGGGICQVSSTLYNSVLRANLEIVERTNHMFKVGYVPIGTDATVSWGAPDFKFKNNRSYPIKIVATTTSNKSCVIKIFGLKEENDYEVEIQSYQTGTIAYKTTYVTNSSLGSGKTRVIQAGSNGATSITYKILKRNGVVVDKVIVSRDRYEPHNQVIERG